MHKKLIEVNLISILDDIGKAKSELKMGNTKKAKREIDKIWQKVYRLYWRI